jgi:hypothetical protein
MSENGPRNSRNSSWKDATPDAEYAAWVAVWPDGPGERDIGGGMIGIAES